MIAKLFVLLHGAPSANSLELLLYILGPVCVIYLVIYAIRKARSENTPDNILPFEAENMIQDALRGSTSFDAPHDDEVKLAA